MVEADAWRRPAWVPWWALALWAGAVALLGAGLVQTLSCRHGDCLLPRAAGRLLDADALGSLPRLFTTSVFVAVTVLAARALARSAGRVRLWWSFLTVVGVGLSIAKLTSEHSVLEHDDGRTATLLGATAAVLVGGLVLRWSGRRWGVPGADRVVTALFLYALAALGLDQVTGLAHRAGPRTLGVLATYTEETAEAVIAVLLLVVVRTAWVRLAGGQLERQE